MIETLEIQHCKDLLGNNYIGRLAYIAHGAPHVIPITYYYYPEDNSIISYSAEGHKMKAMRENPLVSLEVDEIASVGQWQSILVHGEFEELHGIDAKHLLHKFTQGVSNLISRKHEGKPQVIREFSSKMQNQGIPVVFRIKITEITGKQRLKT